MTLTVEDHEDVYEDPEDYYPYEFEDEDEDDDDLDEVYLSSSSNLRIGNRRWGDNGYVRAGHQEARPVYQADFKDSGACTSRKPKKKGAAKDRTGRRAKRTLKREAADKAAASKHQQHLARLGRKWFSVYFCLFLHKPETGNLSLVQYFHALTLWNNDMVVG